jgi:APA family basic amino acid/polyamine antiporter
VKTPRIGTFTAACLLVSNAVGSGIFTTTGFMARDLGDPRWVLALWAAGGALALVGAMSYAELGAALPRSGGDYVYVRRAYGPLAGFLSGWTSFAIGFGGAIAAAAAAFAAYAAELLPAAQRPADPTPLALALVWGLAAVHARGVAAGGRVQRALTVAKVAGIGLLVAAGVALGRTSWSGTLTPAADAAPGLGAAGVSLVFVMYAYSGWNATACVAGELADPARTLPRATLAGTAFVAALYLLVNLAYFRALPIAELASEPVLPVARKAAAALVGPEGARALVALLCVSIAGAASAMVWAGPRVYAAMAADGAAPAWLEGPAGGGAPLAAIALQSAWVTLLLATGTFEQLVVWGGVALAIWTALSVGAVMVLRRREPALVRPYRVVPYPLVPLVYVAASLAIAAYGIAERPTESGLAAATVLAGVPLYHAWRKPMSSPANDTAGVLIRPPLLYLCSLLAGGALEWLVPLPVFPAWTESPLGPVLIAVALVLFVLAVREFARARTPIPTNEPTQAIVRSGPYRVSRNPIYLAFTLLHLGIALWVNGGWLLAALVATTAILRFGVIAREERYLERRFGDAYLDYKRSVRRWI